MTPSSTPTGFRFSPEKLRELRQRAGWTRPELARRADVKVSTLCKYEYAYSNPSWPAAQRLARALAVGSPYAFYVQINDIEEEL